MLVRTQKSAQRYPSLLGDYALGYLLQCRCMRVDPRERGVFVNVDMGDKIFAWVETEGTYVHIDFPEHQENLMSPYST